MVFCCLVLLNGYGDDDDEDDDDDDENGFNSYWKIHHKACYGVLVLHTNEDDINSAGSQTFKGFTMSQYCERFETKHRQKIEIKDKQLLKQLTANTLFCEFCYRPFLKDKAVEEELTTPYVALLDYISAITFVLIPIAWLPLIVLFTIFSFIDYIRKGSKRVQSIRKTRTAKQYDSEYIPN